MQERPNRVQTAVEVVYTASCATTSRAATWTTRWRAKWFPFIATLFLFIWFSNLIGYIPLPTNTEHKVDIGFGAHPVRSRSTPRRPTCRSRSCWRSWCSSRYTIEGVRAKGFGGYLKG